MHIIPPEPIARAYFIIPSLSAYQIHIVIVVFVILVFKAWFVLLPKATRGFEPIIYRRVLLSTLLTCHCIRCLHNLLNVLGQTANKLGLQKNPS
jgi:hypothetical protein